MLKPLTSLRFFAAVSVFLSHPSFTQFFAAHYSFGLFGVGFFFVLSGFILTYAHRNDFAVSVRAPAALAFWRARFARIYPVHALTLALFLAIFSIVGVAWSVPSLFAQIFLVQSWSPLESVRDGFNPVAWSISCEAFFYAVFPFAAWVVFRIARRVPTWGLVAIAAGFYLAGSLLALACPAFWIAYAFPPMRLIDCVFGMLVGTLFLRADEPAAPSPRATLAEIGAVALVAAAVLASPAVPLTFRTGCYMMPVWGLLVYVFGLRGGALSRWLSHPAAVLLGEISFAFYMLHVLVTWMLATLAQGRVNPVALLAASFAATIGCSIAVYLRFEQPIRARLRGIWR